MSDPDHRNLICREFPVGFGWIRVLENLLIGEYSLVEILSLTAPETLPPGIRRR
jgi:hypothetical protein